MKEHIVHQRLYGVILISSFIFLSDMLSLKGKRLDFYGRGDTHVSLTNTIPELSRFTACIDLVFMGGSSSYWIAFSYVTNNPFLGREDIDFGLAGKHQQLILYYLGKAFYISYHLIPFRWHTICLRWDGVKGRLELFLNKKRILIVMDQPHNLTPNGTLVLGHFPKNGVGQIKSLVPHFTVSLYYFQLWDRILENEEFMKCLSGNVVNWEEDVWLVNKIIPTVDTRLRCFVSENMTIQDISTTLSQQTELTTPSQVTGLKPHKTVHYSPVMSKSIPVFATDYATMLYFNTTLPTSETITSKILRTSIAKTATSTADALSTSAAMTLPTQSISICNATDSMKTTTFPSSEITRTAKIVEAMATNNFHPTMATNFLSASGFTKNSATFQTSAIESQSVVLKTASLFSTSESTSMSTTSWPKHKTTDISIPPSSTSGQEFLESIASRTVPWPTVGGTSDKSTGIRTTSAFTPKSLLNSTAASMDSVFPRNQTVSTLATTDMKIAFTIHSVMPTETMPALITAETELPSTNFQNVSSPNVEDAISTFMSQETSSMTLFPMTSFPLTGTQRVQTGTNAESSHTTLPLGITHAPAVTETTSSPTITEPVNTQNTPTAGDRMFTLISTISSSTPKAFESGPTSLTGETTRWFSSKETTWTSRPSHTLLTSTNTTTILTFVPNKNGTSALYGNTTNTENSSTTTNVITPPESPMESNAITSADATGVRYTTTLSKLTSPWLANFSTASGTASVTNLPEFKHTTLLKTIPIPMVAASELPSTPGEMVVSPVDIISTLADIKLNFSTEESPSEIIHTETDGTSTFGDTTAPVPKSATTQKSDDAMTTKEMTSHHLKGKSTTAAVSEVSLFSTVLEVTDESAQTVTASVTVSPFLGVEKLTTLLDNKTATAELEGSSYSGTTEVFNWTPTYTAQWTSETPKGHLALFSTPESTQIFPEPLHTSTTRITGTLTDRTAMTLSSSILPQKTAGSHSSAAHTPITHTFSQPVTISPVTSMVVSGETKMTTFIPSKAAMDFSTSLSSDVSNLSSATMTSASMLPLSQTTSMTNDVMPTQTDSIHTTSEAIVISTTMTPMEVPSQTETLVPLPRSPFPITTKSKATLPSTSGDTVTQSTHNFVCSKPAANDISIVPSPHAVSTVSKPVATQSMPQVEETSTSALSFPFTISGSGDVASLATGTTETPIVTETISSHTSANNLTASVDVRISHPSTHFVNMPASTQLVTGISTLSSDKDQMTISLANTSRTMEVTEMSPSKYSFISGSQSTTSFEMTDTGFSETRKMSSHQTYLPSEIPLGTSADGISTLSTTSKSTWTIPSLTLNSTVDVHFSEMSNSLGKTTMPSRSLTETTLLFPEKESTNALSIYTPGTVEMIVNSSSVTHEDASFVDTTTSRTTRISNPELINITLPQFSSLKTQSEVTAVASSISESIQTYPKSLSPSTTGPSNSDFTVSPTNGITTTLSVPNVPTLLGETSMAMSIPISQMSSLPIDATAFTYKNVSDPFTVIMTKSSKTTYPACLRSSSIATSGPMSETTSLPVNDSTFTSATVSSDTSTTVESFSTLLSPTSLSTMVTTQASTLKVTPVTYPGLTSKSTVVSSAFTTSETTEVSSKITPTSISSPTEATFLSMISIPTTSMAGAVTSVVDTTSSLLLSSKNTEVISSIPKTTFFSSVSATQQSPQEDEVTPLSIFSGVTNCTTSTVSNGRVTALTNTYSRTLAPEIVLSSTSDNHRTALNIQVSPSWANFKSMSGPTESIKATTNYLSSNTGKMIYLLENASLTTSFTKGVTSDDLVLYPSRTPSSETTPSLTSVLYSSRGSEAEFSTPKISLTSQVVGFPVMGTRITSSNTQSLLMSSWNTHRAEDSQFPLSTTTHNPTHNKMETETIHLVPGSLSTFSASETSLLSTDATASSSSPTSGILPTLGISESTSLSTSLRALPTSQHDIKHTLEETPASVTPGTTLPSSPSLISKTTTSPILTWVLSSLPPGSPLMTVSKDPHAVTSSMLEVSKSTFSASDMTPTYTFTNFTKLPFATGRTILTEITSTSPLGSTTSGSPTSVPMSTKVTDIRMYSRTSPETSSRTTMIDNSRTAFKPPYFSGMSVSPSTTDRTVSFGSMSLPSATKISAWSKIPATSPPTSLILPKTTLDSLINVTTTTSTTTGTSFPFMSTGVAHSSTAVVSSLISSSFETTWLDSTFSILTTEAMTSPIAISFYNIEMTLSVFDEESRVLITSVIHEFAKDWLSFIFEDSEFCLANLAVQIKSRDTSEEEMALYWSILEQREGQAMATISHVPYSCACQAIIKAISSLKPMELISKIRNKIYGNLTHGNFTQDDLLLLVKSDHVVVKKLDPGMCKPDETSSNYKGTYKWLLTNPTETAQTRCIKNEEENATRICSISIQTGKSQWEKPRFKQCKLLQELPDKIVDLANITINDENADDVAEHILNLINESPPLDEEETRIIVSKVDEISKCDEISMNITQIILQIISTILEKQNDSTSNLHQLAASPVVSGRILRIIERAGHKMEFSGRTANITVSKLALAVLRVGGSFEGMAFGIHSYEDGTTPETKDVTKTLTSYVVSAGLSDMSIQNLADPVVITLQHIEGNLNYHQVHCAFWDFEINNGLGGWNSSGCKVKETNINYTICQCDHLTHFGVLMDLSRSTVDPVNERILVIITYTGCGISSTFLGIAMVTYIAFYKLRKDYPSKILINLCTALLMLNLAFLINSWLSSFHNVGLCVTAAVALHYFLLVSLTWMGLEAVHMYFALVKVFNIYIPNYILKFCLVGWGVPAITVAVILSVRKDLYGTLSPTTLFCWIKDDSIFYASVVVYFCLIFFVNLSMFCTVLAQLNSMKFQRQKTRRKMILRDLKGTLSLTFLLGLTWGFAFFAWGPVRIFFLYLFAICNTLQGFLIFVFYCMMKESVREQWRIHLRCGWLRLGNFSDGSSRCGVNVGYKQERVKKTFEHKLLMPSLKSSATSSTFKSLGSVQDTPSEISFSNGR